MLCALALLGCGRAGYTLDASDAMPIDPLDGGTLDGGGITPLACGDGVVATLTEQCDDGNVAPGDGCSGSCDLEDPGNGSETCVDPPVIQWAPVGAGRLGARAHGTLVGSSGDLIASCGGGGLDRVYGFAVEQVSDLYVATESVFEFRARTTSWSTPPAPPGRTSRSTSCSRRADRADTAVLPPARLLSAPSGGTPSAGNR
jgi:cysteine-rich repeat protein